MYYERRDPDLDVMQMEEGLEYSVRDSAYDFNRVEERNTVRLVMLSTYCRRQIEYYVRPISFEIVFLEMMKFKPRRTLKLWRKMHIGVNLVKEDEPNRKQRVCSVVRPQIHRLS
ncbi:unnamed protein product [Enterobius vermicularis]|uniref:DBD_Tnp_Mut domain-containing protein n=1 Tax=Enterobius vermicularis TaxID=51028 RepID=A0A0N4VHZ7_ENTVE|nr:unnamed protein product [Enterobius vermicularis]